MDSFLLEARAVAAATANSSTTRGWVVGCHAWNPRVHNAFGYRPSMAAGVIFVILFAAITLAHLIQVGLSRKWWYTVLVAGAVGSFHYIEPP